MQLILPPKSNEFLAQKVDVATPVDAGANASVVSNVELERTRNELVALKSENARLREQNADLLHFKQLYEQQKKISNIASGLVVPQLPESASSSTGDSTPRSAVGIGNARQRSPAQLPSAPDSLQTVYDDYERLVHAYLNLMEENNVRLRDRRAQLVEQRSRLRALQLRIGVYDSLKQAGAPVAEVERHW